MTPQDPLGAVHRQKARSRLWGRLKDWYWRRWEARHVVRYADGRTVIRDASTAAAIRWYERQEWPW